MKPITPPPSRGIPTDTVAAFLATGYTAADITDDIERYMTTHGTTKRAAYMTFASVVRHHGCKVSKRGELVTIIRKDEA